ncbi:hypothetical protein KTH02_01875 [Acinetobacter radioresistens]|uniref:hypothetical protein n=1 Tax=Acinetobacter radioresistens TaxID=40216 RepID=UPI0021CD1CFD|nr:hypothetical protein [Acinetobacter radioresistens]MCU4307621.1 hypothetical protein [Acinetobacter radioresistens]
MKKTKQNLYAEWEVISMAEWLEGLGRNPTNDELIATYKGNFFPLYLNRHVDKKQIWTLTIQTTLQGDDGSTHEYEMEWAFNKPMSIKEVINGAKHIKVESDGIKTRWQGVSKQWLDAVDEDLKGLTAVSAWATATCVGMVEQRNPAAVLLGKMISWGATA